jgi:hypothetical protein
MVAFCEDSFDGRDLVLQHVCVVDHADIHLLRVVEQEFVHPDNYFLA